MDVAFLILSLLFRHEHETFRYENRLLSNRRFFFVLDGPADRFSYIYIFFINLRFPTVYSSLVLQCVCLKTFKHVP